MMQNVNFNISKANLFQKNNSNIVQKQPSCVNFAAKNPIKQNYIAPVVNLNTALNSTEDKKKYEYVLSYMQSYPKTQNSDGLTVSQQLDVLLKNGKLLSRNSNDKSSVLDNLFEIATTKRASGLDGKILISNILDNIIKPSTINQQFGDIPQKEKTEFLQFLNKDEPSFLNPEVMDVVNSGTCAAASCEVNLADKYPAEYTRWVNKLSSEDMKLSSKIKLDSLSKNPLEALTILDLMEAKKNKMDYKTVDIEIKPDKNAYLRAINQTRNWDYGERNVADVLIQSAIMQVGSQNTYDSLTDVRAGGFSSEPQGLIEIEKTYVESVMKNKEITSLVYQVIDDDKNLLGYACTFDKIQKHITDTIDSGDDVILGYIETYKTTGKENEAKAQNASINHVLGGHEITIVDYQKDKQGRTQFIYVDTDDNSPEYSICYADELIPKIHHAGYPASIVENDVNDIMKNEIKVAA